MKRRGKIRSPVLTSRYFIYHFFSHSFPSKRRKSFSSLEDYYPEILAVESVARRSSGKTQGRSGRKTGTIRQSWFHKRETFFEKNGIGWRWNFDTIIPFWISNNGFEYWKDLSRQYPTLFDMRKSAMTSVRFFLFFPFESRNKFNLVHAIVNEFSIRKNEKKNKSKDLWINISFIVLIPKFNIWKLVCNIIARTYRINSNISGNDTWRYIEVWDHVDQFPKR